MQDPLISGILAVPLLTGLVEVAKRSGLPGRYAALLALALGIALTAVGYVADNSGWRGPYDALLQGIAYGLASSGLYSVAGAVTRRQRPKPERSAVGSEPHG